MNLDDPHVHSQHTSLTSTSTVQSRHVLTSDTIELMAAPGPSEDNQTCPGGSATPPQAEVGASPQAPVPAVAVPTSTTTTTAITPYTPSQPLSLSQNASSASLANPSVGTNAATVSHASTPPPLQQKKSKDERKREREQKEREKLLRKTHQEEEDKNKIVAYSPDKKWIKYKYQIGSGSFKNVHLGYDSDRAHSVAWCEYKLQRPGPGGPPELTKDKRQTLIKEIEYLMRLSHPNIVELRHHMQEWVSLEDGKEVTVKGVVIITELMGSSLRSCLQKYHVPPANGEVLLPYSLFGRWWREILDALEYMHKGNLIHRDLKADNCFVYQREGDKYTHVKVGDFGLASELTSSTELQSIIGTFGFMGPEIFSEKYDTAVDIYAFGMVMYEVLTNKLPATTKKPFFYGMANALIYNVPAEVAHMRRDAAMILRACLHPVPEFRPTAEDLKWHPLFNPECSTDNEGTKRVQLLAIAVEPNTTEMQQQQQQLPPIQTNSTPGASATMLPGTSSSLSSQMKADYEINKKYSSWERYFQDFVESLAERCHPVISLRLKVLDPRVLQEMDLTKEEALEFDFDIYRGEEELHNVIHELKREYAPVMEKVFALSRLSNPETSKRQADRVYASIRSQLRLYQRLLQGMRVYEIFLERCPELRTQEGLEKVGQDAMHHFSLYSQKWVEARTAFKNEIAEYLKRVSQGDASPATSPATETPQPTSTALPNNSTESNPPADNHEVQSIPANVNDGHAVVQPGCDHPHGDCQQVQHLKQTVSLLQEQLTMVSQLQQLQSSLPSHVLQSQQQMSGNNTMSMDTNVGYPSSSVSLNTYPSNTTNNSVTNGIMLPQNCHDSITGNVLASQQPAANLILSSSVVPSNVAVTSPLPSMPLGQYATSVAPPPPPAAAAASGPAIQGGPRQIATMNASTTPATMGMTSGTNVDPTRRSKKTSTVLPLLQTAGVGGTVPSAATTTSGPPPPVSVVQPPADILSTVTSTLTTQTALPTATSLNITNGMNPPPVPVSVPGRYHHLLRLSSLECLCEDGSWRLMHSSGSSATVASVMASWRESLLGPVWATFHVEMLMNAERQSWCVSVLFNWVEKEKPIPVPRVLNLRDKPRVEYNLRFTMATMLEALRQNEAPRLQLNTDYHFHPCPVRLGNVFAMRVPMTEPIEESGSTQIPAAGAPPSAASLGHMQQRAQVPQPVLASQQSQRLLLDSDNKAAPLPPGCESGTVPTAGGARGLPSWTDEQLLHDLHERIANRDHATIVLTFNRSPIVSQEATYRLFDIPRASLFAGIYEEDGRLRHIMKQGRALPLLIGQDANPDSSPRFFQAPTQGAAVINPLGVIKQLDTPHIILPVTDALGHTLWVNELPLDCALNENIPLAAKDKYLLIWEQMKKDIKKINQNIQRYANQQQTQQSTQISTANANPATGTQATSSTSPPPTTNNPPKPVSTNLVSVPSSRCSSPPAATVPMDLVTQLPLQLPPQHPPAMALIEQLNIAPVDLPHPLPYHSSSAMSSRPLSPVVLATPTREAQISPPLTFHQLPPYLREAFVTGQMTLQQITLALHQQGQTPPSMLPPQIEALRTASIASLPGLTSSHLQSRPNFIPRQMSLHSNELVGNSMVNPTHMMAVHAKGESNGPMFPANFSAKDHDATPTSSLDVGNSFGAASQHQPPQGASEAGSVMENVDALDHTRMFLPLNTSMNTGSTNKRPTTAPSYSLDETSTRNLLAQEYHLMQHQANHGQAPPSNYSFGPVPPSNVTPGCTTPTFTNPGYEPNMAVYMPHPKQSAPPPQHPLATSAYPPGSGTQPGSQPPTYWHRDDSLAPISMSVGGGGHVVHSPYPVYPPMQNGVVPGPGLTTAPAPPSSGVRYTGPQNPLNYGNYATQNSLNGPVNISLSQQPGPQPPPTELAMLGMSNVPGTGGPVGYVPGPGGLYPGVQQIYGPRNPAPPPPSAPAGPESCVKMGGNSWILHGGLQSSSVAPGSSHFPAMLENNSSAGMEPSVCSRPQAPLP